MADLQDLLVKTSRTFALAIPLLPEPSRTRVTVAYLLFRIADTFEDAVAWSPQEQVSALAAFEDLLRQSDPARTRSLSEEWSATPPLDHAGYLELLRETPFVLDAFFGIEDEAREIIRHHTARTCRGMADIVRSKDDQGTLELRDLAGLRDYCYIVAGIVGEMLTDLYIHDQECLAPVADELRARARAFGEALQLTNILKDSSADAAEGRSFVPAELPRNDVFQVARQDLIKAQEYVTLLQDAGCAAGIVEFNALPVLLAAATLERVQEEGAGAKISRAEVWEIFGRMKQAVAEGTPAIGSISGAAPNSPS